MSFQIQWHLGDPSAVAGSVDITLLLAMGMQTHLRLFLHTPAVPIIEDARVNLRLVIHAPVVYQVNIHVCDLLPVAWLHWYEDFRQELAGSTAG